MIPGIVRLFFVLCVTAIACNEDVLSPSEVEGVYVLERYNDKELPALFSVTPNLDGSTMSAYLVTDTLRIRHDRTALFGSRLFRLSTVLNGDEQITWSRPGQYTAYVYWAIGNRQIRFEDLLKNCGDCSRFIFTWWGTITATGIDLRSMDPNSGIVHKFRRVG